MRDAWIVTLLSLVPRRAGSRLQGALARGAPGSALQRALVRWYVRHYDVDLSEVDGRLEDFATLADFFTRPLREGARPVAPDPDVLVSPADGRLVAAGRVVDGRLDDRAAGLRLAVAELLRGDHGFDAGSYAVVYLSPRDYHRVHHPREGRLVAWAYVPGDLWPVFPASVRRLPDLFARNERLVAWIDAEGLGPLAVVMVGAYGVGRMTAAFADIATNTGAPAQLHRLGQATRVARGEELGRFGLGSTVVLLAANPDLQWLVPAGSPVRVGQALARLPA